MLYMYVYIHMWTRVVTHSWCICGDIILNHGDFDMVTISFIVNNDITKVNNIVSNNTTISNNDVIIDNNIISAMRNHISYHCK